MKIISICAFRIWYEWNLHLPQKICFDIATLVSKLELLVPHNTGHRVVCLQDFRLFRKGPFIKDVRTKGGEPKSRHSKGGFVDLLLQI